MTDDSAAPDEPTWDVDDLEAAYRKALESLDAVETVFEQDAEAVVAASSNDDSESDRPSVSSVPVAIPATNIPRGSSSAEPDDPRVSPRQVVEACLFVAGEPLSSKRIAGILKNDFSSDAVETLISDLNIRYQRENRSYEVVLVEGGYRLALKSEFEKLRRKVYGQGPKEVKLSQDALEVLALVAYHEPVTEQKVAELGKPNPGSTLRQLLQRELLAVERDPKNRKLVRYRTTPRFLSLFGLRSLRDLPKPENLSFK